MWLEILQDRQVTQQQENRSEELAGLIQLHNSERQRLRQEILNMEKARIAALCGLGQGSKRQQELASSIAFFAMAMWQRQAARSVRSKLEFRVQVHQKTIANIGDDAFLGERLLNQLELIV